MTDEQFVILMKNAAIGGLNKALQTMPDKWRTIKLKHFDMTLVEIRQRMETDRNYLMSALATSIGTGLVLQLIDMVAEEAT